MTPATNPTIERATRAFRADSLPCNPRPFITALASLVETDGPAVLQAPKGRAVLWVLLSQAFGQCATVNLMSLWDELDAAIPEELPAP